MDRTRLDDKRWRVAVLLGEAPAEVVARFARSFDVEYAHNSTAIEGNTLSLIQTKVILEDGLSVGGKALREGPVLCADETERATASFDEYYEVMVETAERDGFAPAPKETYQDMISVLGPDHCRVFAARDSEGALVSWAISTISGERAVYYYAASSARSRELLATDRLFYFECCELARLGCTSYDLMGIGSDFSPSLLGLNTFKTKFAKDGERPVAPDRDLPVKRAFYRTLVGVRDVRDRLRGSSEE